MMKIFLPEIGTVLTLGADWTFDVYMEGRNESILHHLALEYDHTCYSKKVGEYTIHEGQDIKVDRIYIRKGSSDFSSVSLFHGSDRFWVKLKDFNRIEVSHVFDPYTIPVIKFTCPHHSVYITEKLLYHVIPNKITYTIDGVDKEIDLTVSESGYYTTLYCLGIEATEKNLIKIICKREKINKKDYKFKAV